MQLQTYFAGAILGDISCLCSQRIPASEIR